MEDGLFLVLLRAVPKPKAQDARKDAWILGTTCILVYKIVSARRDPARYQSLIWRLGRAIAESLKGYWRSETVGRGGGRVGGEVIRVRPPTPPGILAPDEGFVSGYG